MRGHKEHSGAWIVLGLSDSRVEVRRRIERHIVVLRDDPSDQPRSRLIPHVPALEERLLDHRHGVPHRRVVRWEAQRGVGHDVELLARRRDRSTNHIFPPRPPSVILAA